MVSSNIADVARHIKDEEIPENQWKISDTWRTLLMVWIARGLSAFLNEDMNLVRGIKRDDDKVDDLLDKALNGISNSMFQEKDAISYMVYHTVCCQVPWRIADRAENIGDRTIYMITCEKPGSQQN